MPNPFSTYLAELLHRDGRTLARLVRDELSVVPLPRLHAYRGGFRLPATMTIVNQIATTLSLNVADAAKLRRRYILALDERTQRRVWVQS